MAIKLAAPATFKPFFTRSTLANSAASARKCVKCNIK